MAIMLLLLLIYGVSFIAAPFPYWRTYFLLWKKVFWTRNKVIGAGARWRQAKFLLGYLLSCPLLSCLWYLDELLFPGYRKGKVRPVFIIGQPRCGTTLLHRTLAQDQDTFYAIRHIEWRYPFIVVQKAIQFLRLDGWLTKKSYWPDTQAGREAAKMHPDSLGDWEEDGIFYEERFLQHFFVFLRFPYPELLPLVDGFTHLPPRVQRRMQVAHKKVLQKILYLRGGEGKFYLSKEVTSHEKIESMLHLYPDAKFVIITRQSGEFMGSLMQLVRTSTLAKTGVDPVHVPDWESQIKDRMRRDSQLLVELSKAKISPERQVKTSFNLFIQNISGTIASIYEALGREVKPDYARCLKEVERTQGTRERGYTYAKVELPGFEEYDGFVKRIEQTKVQQNKRGILLWNRVA